MSVKSSRNCPICGNKPNGVTFPYATQYNSYTFHYMKCATCISVFVDPIPNDDTFSKMYAKSEYHDCHYEGVSKKAYIESVNLLAKHASIESLVLDYGCGTGAFLSALSEHGFKAYGVEFDESAANQAHTITGCEVLSVGEFKSLSTPPKFDVIHLGDVLEHLPNPKNTINELEKHLKPGGLFFIEGPLEVNPSFVYWSAQIFGYIKKTLKPNFIANHKPTHLFRTGEKQQRDFFLNADLNLKCLHWNVYETGWPYQNGGVIKRIIAFFANIFGGYKIINFTFGNRFKGLFLKNN